MNIVRLEKGKNDFAIANLTLGKLHVIQRAVQVFANIENEHPIAQEVKEEIEYFMKKHPNLEPWGEDCVKKVCSRESKSYRKEY